ncbi:hypothetical protein AB205_0069860 [Aquarana catesbeiana]|uniref:GIY-YIG domain-containing protein n=1 Tax=Aquarana catesbeiana TaxID=8400 RepID=A0A2G9SJE7_AQUCT|nr:hypothetical protein AB205_0069860 [Aquarana catesbeiana]
MPEKSILARGLTFALTASPNPFTLFLDLNRFIRNITIKRYFNIQDTKKGNGTPNITPNTTPYTNNDHAECSTTTEDSSTLGPAELIALDHLEDLYIDDQIESLTQHPPTSPPILHTKFKPKSIFYPTFAKRPYVQTFYQDYETHGLLLKAKFKDKGYPDHIIEDAFQYYLSENAKEKRQTSTDNTTQPVRFVTQYHNRFKQMEKIFTKHWSILREDPQLNPTISDKPLVTYRQAKNIKAQIAPSKVKTAHPTASAPLTFFNIKGMYQCRKPLSLTCAHVTHRQKDFHHKGKLYVIPDFFNCGSDYVVYCLTCPCGLLYVGRTIRPLRKRFGEHHNLVEKGIDKHSVPRHFKEHHGQTSSGLCVWVIESIPPTLPTAECYKR